MFQIQKIRLKSFLVDCIFSNHCSQGEAKTNCFEVGGANKDQEIEATSKPLLVLLGIPLEAFIFNSTITPSHSQHESSAQTMTDNLVGDLYQFIKDIIQDYSFDTTENEPFLSFDWRIQPFLLPTASNNTNINNLKDGFLAGINWLLRSIMTNRVDQYF